MKLLALETSLRQSSFALLEGDQLLRQVELDPALRTAAALTPALEEAFRNVDWSPGQIELIAVSHGPGSFTGLRIGVATAKALAYVAQAEVLGIDTLRVIAAQSPADVHTVQTIIDAQRQEVFAAKYQRQESIWNGDDLPEIVEIDAWIASLQPGDCVSGTALAKLREEIPSGVEVLPERCWRPMAATVGQLAWTDYQSGARGDHWNLAPQYYRKSAAEEKLDG
ncbi:tRNA (adenosine(37)-N6)-threonylcarbamoyltransferase complex dimerization subunit type 1 TsaB [Blastopirellula sp. J2-11]|uniref:tRNA (adenosine(37)-N6)-threonylcarbamoyltransferase complex dimerization subunit type 1 TsaB n=1 Tax=Blastopirellula sp. J2-11 TaxID=2943192 RepID=UPI0021CA2B2F|nr:tRNA (adenosine(37)-N6)-threonylcarbamoyltransferase complex dimerization subunit type 1 TsaB [Blastopirellula sp. J2-11]UUO05436.1 tRNA (adenosine(37)-N6)-threonylcarbamoyltransferase complex dimerization subunit type 1 TsaB [Blastopirellula sp. J2-11]